MDVKAAFADLAGAAPGPVATGGDFTVDGLLHCGKCRTPKQLVLTNPLTGETSKVSCTCRCEQEEAARLQAEFEERQRRRRADEARAACFGSRAYADFRFSQDDGQTPELRRRMEGYVRHFPELASSGQGLLLFGDVGTGKTFYTACIANELVDRGFSVLMTDFPGLVAKLQRMAFDRDDPLPRLLGYDLLVIDDLGVERGTEYMQEQVYSIVDSRYRAGKPMVVSTNLTAEQLKHPQSVMEARIYDRVLERCLPVRVEAPNRRKRKAGYSAMAALIDS